MNGAQLRQQRVRDEIAKAVWMDEDDEGQDEPLPTIAEEDELPPEEPSEATDEDDDAEADGVPEDGGDDDDMGSVCTLANAISSVSLIPLVKCLLCKRTTHDRNEMTGPKSIFRFKKFTVWNAGTDLQPKKDICKPCGGTWVVGEWNSEYEDPSKLAADRDKDDTVQDFL